MNVKVDQLRCDGHARCMALVPEIFEVDDDEISVVIDPHPEGEIADRVRQAAVLCPKQAIVIIED